jgi:hypothetical protein
MISTIADAGAAAAGSIPDPVDAAVIGAGFGLVTASLGAIFSLPFHDCSVGVMAQTNSISKKRFDLPEPKLRISPANIDT